MLGVIVIWSHAGGRTFVTCAPFRGSPPSTTQTDTRPLRHAGQMKLNAPSRPAGVSLICGSRSVSRTECTFDEGEEKGRPATGEGGPEQDHGCSLGGMSCESDDSDWIAGGRISAIIA